MKIHDFHIVWISDRSGARLTQAAQVKSPTLDGRRSTPDVLPIS